MMTRTRITAAALTAGLAIWGCSPEDYPTSSRFEPPPEEIVLPDGELFFYIPPAGVSVTSVNVPGSFNGWDNTANPMTELPDGRWVAGIELEEGEYEYKYFFNGTDWAGNMCNDATWGDPANGNKVDPAVETCNGENATKTVGTPGHTFLYIPRDDRDVEVVTVAGSFQDPQWTNDTDTLNNIWEFTVDLEPGTYQYKYLFGPGGWAGNMCDEGTWGHPDFGNAVDPDNDTCSGDNAEITIDEAGPHTFRYIVPAGADSIPSISIAGSFQDPQWTPDVDLFTETFQRTYDVPEGSYEYKFIFDGNWAGNMCTDTGNYGDPTTGLVDANNTDGCVDGGENALLIVD